MTATEKKKYMEMPTIGYYSGFGGIEIKGIEYGIEDHVIFVANSMAGKRSVHRAMIHYTDKHTYFRFAHNMISFEEIIRC